ncbi:hypothetical protein GM415_02780 [Pseudodesulfovibrio cashew]|uniref:Uncharacterized protein n=1 Tax=Pseudodesulfovibrio cashew TaxID=2678688 RepID=A0A6I6JFA9_9BACT|nr:hypothetical protein [Pseudodesulfovibrio cashew]QGY39092.1 hypothetical protein GM415_02780 [Pseudodesulfovibrio cashew]
MIEYRWNGVGLSAPDDWEVSALERDGFLLEEQGRPRCELKWRNVQGTFSFEKHLKRLQKGHKGVDMRPLESADTPGPWRESLARLAGSGLSAHSFLWRTEVDQGIGAALHNPGTGLAALIQFFLRAESEDALAAEVLASFRDVSAGKTVPWSLFGLAARVPADFLLNTFSFRPGHYAVKYWRPRSGRNAGRAPMGKGPGTSLVFERFAPAGVLLRGTTLETWVRDTLEDPPPESLPMQAGHKESREAVRWTGFAKDSFLRAALRRRVHCQGRVWTTGAGNAILAVRASGSVPLIEETFNTVCESYVLV